MSLPPDPQVPRTGAQLGEHLAPLRRRWAVLVGCVVAGGAAGLALLWLTPASYTATTQVLVMPVGTQEPGNQVTNRQREALNLDTEAQVAQSTVVATRAAMALRGAELEEVEVSVPPNSAVLWIAVTAAEPAAAAAQSHAYAEAYLAHRRHNALTAMAEQQRTVLAKLKHVNSAIELTIKRLHTLPRGSAEHAIAAQRQNVLNRQAANLALKYDELRTVAVTPGAIISKAEPPTEPSGPVLPLHLGTGLMAGLLAGTAAAHARDRLDTRLRTAADIERLTGLPVLADLSRPGEHELPHDLAGAVVAACPGNRLLVKALPAHLYVSSPAEPLAVGAPLTVLDGSDVRDLSRADAALLLVGLRRVTSTEVAATVRRLARHDVPVIGAVAATDAVPSFVPYIEARPHTSLGKLVATGELQVSVPAEGTRMQAPHRTRRRGKPA
ncbi:Wzz/FepE/Etk N-terminal domain-containing protein [Nonomuraea sp. KM88]|uniref:Wzz/FepE/Etk N-terminal domain-containing protein n=1 Tax=Nonomuraea sp. KM88 TaxID=3457427 RepID=UPI003FCCF24A